MTGDFLHLGYALYKITTLLLFINTKLIVSEHSLQSSFNKGDKFVLFKECWEGNVLSFIEIISPCHTGWGVKQVKAFEWIMESALPLGIFRALKNDK